MLRDEAVEIVASQALTEEGYARKMSQILLIARDEIVRDLNANPSQFRYTYLGALQHKVEDALVKMKYDLTRLLDTSVVDAIKAGAQLSQQPESAIASSINPMLLRGLADYRADCIKGVSDACKQSIGEILTRSLLAGKTLVDAEKEIGSVLPDSGVFRIVEDRAHRILRTEYGRILEMANQLGLEKSAQTVPGLKKEWLCTHRKSRIAHIAASGQVVPVSSPFIVGGEALMYPKDPAGSAGNVVNCRCRSIPVVPE